MEFLNRWEDILGDAKQNYRHSLQVDHNHDNDIDFNMNIVENQSCSIVNFNNHHTLDQPEGLVIEYDEQMQLNRSR